MSVSVMDVPFYYGMGWKADGHILFSDALIDQFINDGAAVGQTVTVFNTTDIGIFDGAGAVIDKISDYLDDSFYYIQPYWRPDISDAEMAVATQRFKSSIHVMQLMGIKVVQEPDMQGQNVNTYAEVTKVHRIGSIGVTANYSSVPQASLNVLESPQKSDDYLLIDAPPDVGLSGAFEMEYTIYPNDFRDGSKIKLLGVTGVTARVRIRINGSIPTGSESYVITDGSVKVTLTEVSGDTFYSAAFLDGKEFNTLDIIDEDPYDDPEGPGGDDPEGPGGDDPGGGGDHDETSDDIIVPDLPVLDVLSTGLVSLYSPSSGQVRAMASAMWSTSIAEQLRVLFSQPIDSIISLHFVPVTPPIGGSQNIILGSVDTGVSAPIVTSQYLELSCGSIAVSEFWGAFTDFADTKISIHLPYIGIRNLDTQDVMSSTVTVKYHVDLLTGALTAMVVCSKSGKQGSLNSVVYSFSGNFISDIPVNSRHFSNVLSGLFGVGAAVAGVAGAAFTGGAALPAIGSAASGLIGTAGNFKQSVQRSGSAQTTPGSLGVQTAYLIIERPIQITPAGFGNLRGYGSKVGRNLGSFNGYTQVDAARINIAKATDPEKSEIMQLLRSGVVV